MTTIVLVPTDFERRALDRDDRCAALGWKLELCGFGLVATAARTARLIADHRPSNLVLVGIAGTFDETRAPIGTALEIERVVLAELGAGMGGEYIDTRTMGFPQLDTPSGAIHDTLDLDPKASPEPTKSQPRGDRAMSLSVFAASGSEAHADQRHTAHPDAIVEEMEGFGAALAACDAGVPLRMIRGVSNRVGDRRTERWDIDGAVDAVFERLAAIHREDVR